MKGLKSGEAVLEDELIQQGYLPGTPAFASALLHRKVESCQQVQRVESCRECGRFEHCETAKAYLFDTKYNKPSQPNQVVVEDRLPDWMFGGIKQEAGDSGEGELSGNHRSRR